MRIANRKVEHVSSSFSKSRGGATGGQNEDVAPDGADGLNPTVKLVFDKFTPRPHFVILKNQTNISDTAPQLYDQTFALVTEFLRRKTQYAATAVGFERFL